MKVGTGMDVGFAVNAQGAYAAWTTPAGIEAHVPGQAAPVHLSSSGAFPSLVTLPDGGSLAAWEEYGSIAFHRF